jgi:hypothetical protein
MNITLYQYEVVEAIQEYLTQKYDMDVDLQNNFIDWPCIEYTETETPYKKHKNGKVMKDADGYKILDHENSKRITKHITFGECDEITFYLEPSNNYE